MDRKIKSPTELFEERRLAAIESLEELKRQKTIEEQNKLLNRKIKSPKELFFSDVNENKNEEVAEKKIVAEEVIVESPLRFLSRYYDSEINTLKTNLTEVKDNIPVVEKFDPTDLYDKINYLKESINKVREEIPEQIFYDDQLKKLSDTIDSVRESIPEVPEVKYYDEELKVIVNTINEVRNEIPVVPEIRYYDEQISKLENTLESLPDVKYYDEDIISLWENLEKIRSEISQLPEVKYYDESIQEIEDRISQVKSEIPEVPEVKYYDEQINELEYKISQIKIPEVRYYDDQIIDIQNKISEIKIPEVRYYDEQIKELESNIGLIKSEIPEVKYYDEQIKELEDKISGIKIPEVKYYDSEIENIVSEIGTIKDTLVSFKLKESEKIQDLYTSFENKSESISKKISHIEDVLEKFNEKTIIDEGLLNDLTKTKNEDPLTPLDQNFVTLDQLQEHYRLFINRVQQQLATIGGGGETRLEFLDDVDRNSAKQNGYVLQYNSSVGKFIGTSYVPGGGGSGNVAIAITNTAPTGDNLNEIIWYDNDIGRSFIYYTDVDGSQWVDMSPAGTSVSIPNYWISTTAGIHTTSNVGIGTTSPTTKLEVRGGDIRVGVNTSEGVILTSPNGTKYRLIVSDSGTLSTVLVP